MKNKMKFDLAKDLFIEAYYHSNDIKINVYHGEKKICSASVITDQVDVLFATNIYIKPDYVNYKYDEMHTLAEVLFKLILKFPLVVRKPEFLFILDFPQPLRVLTTKCNFDAGGIFSDKILIRQNRQLPLEKSYLPRGVKFVKSIEGNQFSILLEFLKKNAYWQANLTSNRLMLLVNNSNCYYATNSDGTLIAFVRLLSDQSTFASLWDMVVDKNYRRQGVATNLMFQIFTDPQLSGIENWVLFTDTATSLYEKFGFVAESKLTSPKFVHKIKIQEVPPDYLDETLEASKNLPELVSKEHVSKFLFGQEGKRSNLPSFWKSLTAKQANYFEEPTLGFPKI